MKRTQPGWTLLTSALSALMLGIVGAAAAGNDDGETSGARSAPAEAASALGFSAHNDGQGPSNVLSNPEVNSSAPATAVLDSPEAVVSALQAEAATNAHENGHGCDDIIHSAGVAPGPAGPVGCDVGNSGDHRQNGVSDEDEGVNDEGDDAGTPEDAATPTEDKTDPHANGHGCDDVNHAVGEHEPTLGGPVGCEVGNSGEHRQNGVDHGAPDEDAAPSSATAADGPGNAAGGKAHKK